MNNHIDLHKQWAADMAALRAEANKASDILATILAQYGQEGRHYHGVAHLQALFGLIDAHAPRPAGAAVHLAIWWHDVIYDPLSKENEAQSALMAREHLTLLGAPTALIDQTCALIIATQDHFTAPSFGDEDVFLDADIAILGAPRDSYQRYVDQIRAEYHMVPEPLFTAGRTRFLQGAAGWSGFFKTDVFEAKFGDTARANLAWELEGLGVKGAT